MDATTASPYLSKLLDISIALFLLTVLVLVLGWAIWKLWKQNQEQDVAHAAALAELNALRLTDANAYATNRKESSEQLRGIVEQLNNVLSNLQHEKQLSGPDRKIIVAIATKLGCTPAELQ